MLLAVADVFGGCFSVAGKNKGEKAFQDRTQDLGRYKQVFPYYFAIYQKDARGNKAGNIAHEKEIPVCITASCRGAKNGMGKIHPLIYM
ncbi:hypothetical protein BG74_02390 [Sodalis-like endosymbiont of Proechinophthirus fluctus]|uniref:hypothetical protein n=1 Tax=Sodalis-like endosymbiont of Proechinophthirus fluctus TaxID=1462730 RepID=UPI0007A88ECC|nr:hypothetical protein [Sodalis-like endosymbiont of Proechinophthirus fluctus]KYP97525.1 hypothetical protein BG74_02390 [Sodalis-like endosymbiont of Proechinophthirus fluctus]